MNKFVPFMSVAPFSEKLYGWMDQTIMCDLPLTWCEDAYARKYTNIVQTGGFIARKTVAKYIDRTATEMEKLIARELPPTFGIIFDGWSCDGEHYTAVVATSLALEA